MKLYSDSRWVLMLSCALNLAIAVLALVGCRSSWANNGPGMLRFYTVDSNLFGALACGILGVCLLIQLCGGRAVPGWVFLVKYMATCCLAVTFLVVIFVLAPVYGDMGGYKVMLTQGDMLYHHLLCPVLAILSFLLLERQPMRPPTAALYALIPTIVYAAVTIVLNLARVLSGPYPFLHVYEQPWWASVLWCAVILGGAYFVAWLLAALRQLKA